MSAESGTGRTPEPTVIQVAQDLSEIERLTERLLTQAVAKANDRLMPGGHAMVGLGHVGSRAAQDAYVEALEARWWNDPDATHQNRPDVSHLNDEDDTWEPPLQTLLFWSEERRARYGYPLEGRKPTIATEAAFLRWALDAMRRDEPRWADFAGDVQAARTRLEATLSAGTRPVARGVSCMYDECRGARLIRTTVPTRGPRGAKAWRLTDWHCPRCKRTWSEEDYSRHVYGAIERQHWLILDGETWCTVDRAARKVGRPQGTVRSWVSRGEVAALCLIGSAITQTTFVLLDDVAARDRLAKRRHAQRLDARKRRQTTGV